LSSASSFHERDRRQNGIENACQVDGEDIADLIFRFAAQCPGSAGNAGVGDNQVERVAGVGSGDPVRRRLKVLHINQFGVDGATAFLDLGGHAVKAVSIPSGQSEKGVRTD